MSTKTLPRGNKMGTWPIGKLLINMALPLVISMLVQALYNVVDSIYISRISESAVTALSLAFPIQNLLIGCATGVGVGVNSLLSKSLGEQNYERANRTAGNGVGLSCLFSALFVIFGLFFARPFFPPRPPSPRLWRAAASIWPSSPSAPSASSSRSSSSACSRLPAMPSSP